MHVVIRFRQTGPRFSIDTGKKEAYCFVYDESGKAVVKLYLTPRGDKETAVTAYAARDTRETARMLEIAKYAANRTPGCPAQK